MLDRAAYVGSYSDPLFGSVEVTDADGGLRLRYGYQACALEHTGGDWFRCPWEASWRGEADVQFVPTSSGSIGAVRSRGAEFSRVD
jgi:hypothetical protein